MNTLFRNHASYATALTVAAARERSRLPAVPPRRSARTALPRSAPS